MTALPARLLFLGFLFLGALSPGHALARSTGEYAFTLGIFDVLEIPDGFEGGFEYRLPSQLITMSQEDLGTLTPALGFSLTSAESRYFYGGLRLPLYINTWVLTPHFAAGLFQGGNGKYLGGALEFRSGIEASFYSTGNTLLGISFYHLSNGNLYDQNPGSESIVFVYSFDSFWPSAAANPGP